MVLMGVRLVDALMPAECLRSSLSQPDFFNNTRRSSDPALNEKKQLFAGSDPNAISFSTRSHKSVPKLSKVSGLRISTLQLSNACAEIQR
jgi:hypothetical protein